MNFQSFVLPGTVMDDAVLRAELKRLTLMQSIFMVHLGVKMDVSPYQNQSTRYYVNTYEIERGIDEIERGVYHEGRDGFVIHVPGFISPNAAPPGREAVTIYTIAPNHLAEGDWEAERERLADRLVAEAERFIPGLAARTEVRRIVTPADFRARSHLVHHAFGGIAPELGHRGVSHRTPVPNLWFIGAQSESGGGVNNAILGAFRAFRRFRTEKGKGA